MATWLWTVRHTAEPTLQTELVRLGLPQSAMRVPFPGAVLVSHPLLPDADALRAEPALLRRWQPVWALQVLPNVQEIAVVSIAGAARELLATLQRGAADRGGEVPSWDAHVLVPGQLKGQPKPQGQRRAQLIDEALWAEVRARHPAWRKAKVRVSADSHPPQLLAQLLLTSADAGWLSVCDVDQQFAGVSWPARTPAGLAPVDDDDDAPASAFRKLVEALWLLGIAPQPGQVAVDLGASPGSWTHVLRQRGVEVFAIDRAPLAPHLQRDALVHATQGDAFAWLPPERVDWLVSDIIAFPERVAELLQAWCSGRHMRHFVVQCKFRGEPNWPALQAAVQMAQQHGYVCTARHVFNDKNEATLVGTLSGQGV